MICPTCASVQYLGSKVQTLNTVPTYCSAAQRMELKIGCVCTYKVNICLCRNMDDSGRVSRNDQFKSTGKQTAVGCPFVFASFSYLRPTAARSDRRTAEPFFSLHSSQRPTAARGDRRPAGPTARSSFLLRMHFLSKTDSRPWRPTDGPTGRPFVCAQFLYTTERPAVATGVPLDRPTGRPFVFVLFPS